MEALAASLHTGHGSIYLDDLDRALAARGVGELVRYGGGLPCSGGDRRILLLSASLAYGTPVSLCDTVTGLDDDNTARLLIAIRHAAGKRPENSSYRMPS